MGEVLSLLLVYERGCELFHYRNLPWSWKGNGQMCLNFYSVIGEWSFQKSCSKPHTQLGGVSSHSYHLYILNSGQAMHLYIREITIHSKIKVDCFLLQLASVIVYRGDKKVQFLIIEVGDLPSPLAVVIFCLRWGLTQVSFIYAYKLLDHPLMSNLINLTNTSLK